MSLKFQITIAACVAAIAAQAHASEGDATEAVKVYSARLGKLYASEVTVRIKDLTESPPRDTGAATFSLPAPKEGEVTKRQLVRADAGADTEKAGLPLPLDLASKPEYALPVGDTIAQAGTEACGLDTCNVVTSQGYLGAKRKVQFQARMLVSVRTGVPVSSAVTLSGIPFVSLYSYQVVFNDLASDGYRIARSSERVKGGMLFAKWDAERLQIYGGWLPKTD